MITETRLGRGARKGRSRRVLIVGSGREAWAMAETTETWGAGRYKVVGFVADQEEDSPLGGAMLGPIGGLVDLVRSENAGIVVVALSGSIRREVFEALLSCWNEADVKTVPMMHAELTGRLPHDHFDYDWYLCLLLEHSRPNPRVAFFKRALDIVVSAIGLLFLAVLMPVLAAMIKVDSPGPVLYRQERVGKKGKTFKLIKLRTMVFDAEREGEAVWAKLDDPRVTRVGRFLRLAMLDELPQFFNVLKGDMSIVGPRPERPEIVAQLVEDLPTYHLRHAMRPGMAGWAYINQGYARSLEEVAVKLQYDLHYIRSHSLVMDGRIFARSVMTSLTLRRRERAGRAPGLTPPRARDVGSDGGSLYLNAQSTASIQKEPIHRSWKGRSE